jgi:anti-sigma factor RsiW
MECETVRELLGNYIDEELTQPMCTAIENHLAACPACAADLATLRSTLAKLTSESTLEEPSPWFAERLLQSLARNNDTSLTSIEQPTPDKQLGLW